MIQIAIIIRVIIFDFFFVTNSFKNLHTTKVELTNKVFSGTRVLKFSRQMRLRIKFYKKKQRIAIFLDQSSLLLGKREIEFKRLLKSLTRQKVAKKHFYKLLFIFL